MYRDNPAWLTGRAHVVSWHDGQPVPVVIGESNTARDPAVRRHPREPLFYATHDLHAVLTDLAGRGLQRVFVEGGPTLASAFLREGLADELLVYVAPVLLGGSRLALGDIGVASIADARRLTVASIRQLGDDTLFVARPAAAPGEPAPRVANPGEPTPRAAAPGEPTNRAAGHPTAQASATMPETDENVQHSCHLHPPP